MDEAENFIRHLGQVKNRLWYYYEAVGPMDAPTLKVFYYEMTPESSIIIWNVFPVRLFAFENQCFFLIYSCVFLIFANDLLKKYRLFSLFG